MNGTTMFAPIILMIISLNSFNCYLIIDSPPPLAPPDSSSIIDSSSDLISSLRGTTKEQQQLFNNLQNVEYENLSFSNKENIADNNDLYSADYQLSSCQLQNIIHLLQHPGCQPKAISSLACSGSCPSYVQLSTSKFWQHERSCSCCQQTSLQEATFTLDCPSLDPPYKKVKTYAPVNCMCRSCTDLGREKLQPQELVEALAGENQNLN